MNVEAVLALILIALIFEGLRTNYLDKRRYPDEIWPAPQAPGPTGVKITWAATEDLCDYCDKPEEHCGCGGYWVGRAA